MVREAGAADPDGFLKSPCPPVLFRQLHEGRGRRVFVDPASQFLDPRMIHRTIVTPASRYGAIVSVAVLFAERPRLSATVNVTM
jgi:hypothetical protein